ncbi:DUF4345 domain-containing protein [Lutimonas vermicola]|uniref:DUF4345 domain-containing protein n=1 Tax=Lutimonas vermicola TaxID=414288 RepID=A0ABU9KYE3_9FLAO
MNRKNLHLLISIAVIIPSALMYGLFPEKVLPLLLDVSIDSNDLKNVFRVVMCLYLGIAGIWILGVLRSAYWKFATLLAIVFMGSLSLGRAISFVIDGQPSLIFVLGFFGEFVLAAFSLWQFKRYQH